jgi:hypothetical protein
MGSPLNPLSVLGALPSLTGGQSAPASTADTSTQGPSWLTGKLSQYVTIILGLILIIIGLTQFKGVQTVTKAAAAVA